VIEAIVRDQLGNGTTSIQSEQKIRGDENIDARAESTRLRAPGYLKAVLEDCGRERPAGP
jgi:hypothetical protein